MVLTEMLWPNAPVPKLIGKSSHSDVHENFNAERHHLTSSLVWTNPTVQNVKSSNPGHYTGAHWHGYGHQFNH